MKKGNILLVGILAIGLFLGCDNGAPGQNPGPDVNPGSKISAQVFAGGWWGNFNFVELNAQSYSISTWTDVEVENPVITIESYNPDIASVAPDGTIELHKTGYVEFKILLEESDTHYASSFEPFGLHIFNSSSDLENRNLSFRDGEQVIKRLDVLQQGSYQNPIENGYPAGCRAVSSNPSVAIIDADNPPGVYFHAPGKTQITLTIGKYRENVNGDWLCYPEQEISYELTLLEGQIQTDISFQEAYYQFRGGTQISFINPVSLQEGAPIRFSSSNPEVAMVDALTGEVTLTGEFGRATIYGVVQSEDGIYGNASAYYLVEVKLDPQLSISPGNISINPGEILHLPSAISMNSLAYGNYQYLSLDTGIVQVDPELGELRGISPGVTIVEISQDNSTRLYCSDTVELNVTVRENASLEFLESNPEKLITDERFTNGIAHRRGTGAISYTSSNPLCAQVNPETGEVHFLTVGQTTITATMAQTETHQEVQVSYPLSVMKSFTLNMVQVPGGSFIMDSQGGSSRVSDFQMSAHEITRDQFLEVMGIDPSDVSQSEGLSAPVQNTPFYAMLVFCNKLSLDEGLDPVYYISRNGVDLGDMTRESWETITSLHPSSNVIVNAIHANNGYRLPTPSEWIWAAAGANSQYSRWQQYAGDNGSNTILDCAWITDNSNGISHSVGAKQPNQLGLYDMSGNVAEMCLGEPFSRFSTNLAHYVDHCNFNNSNSASPAMGRPYFGDSTGDLGTQEYLTPKVYGAAHVGLRVVKR